MAAGSHKSFFWPSYRRTGAGKAGSFFIAKRVVRPIPRYLATPAASSNLIPSNIINLQKGRGAANKDYKMTYKSRRAETAVVTLVFIIHLKSPGRQKTRIRAAGQQPHTADDDLATTQIWLSESRDQPLPWLSNLHSRTEHVRCHVQLVGLAGFMQTMKALRA